MFHKLLGIDVLEPGYKKSSIAPRLVKGIPTMQGYIDTAYGKIVCEISCLDHQYTIDIEIPANTTAEVSCLKRRQWNLARGSIITNTRRKAYL